MVAADNYDLHAARSFGLPTAFIPRPAEYGPSQTKDLRPEGPWDIVATDLEDFR
jgi:2-haloacid dehalogenase